MNVSGKMKPDFGIEENVIALKSNHFTMIEGPHMQSLLGCSIAEENEFSAQWNELTLDQYMGDGGTYRFRRYGQFQKFSESNSLQLLPHEPYVQSSEVNYLNGDVKRIFDPLTDTFVQSPVLERTLMLLADLYDQTLGQKCDWNIRLHPYRIQTTSDQIGQPAPEGLHRDGVTFIASMMLQRRDATGGVTRLTDDKRQPLATIELKNRFDIVLSDDAKTLHDVSSVTPLNAADIGYRDVLVIAFTLLGNAP
ncbi:2OG-Fe dioxygenase family protein [uncultured Microbulbifer sp.]|uniref:2OG-Fe dioxygenase family protein n=1 Tax=uncultured Microbulbifer sp. TaxID=348147 RepID=UPI0026194612|nr:2OG-Fe dioxygenase family protein [uncultured Microbulbifer sp.]